jgi:hypothetical protein
MGREALSQLIADKQISIIGAPPREAPKDLETLLSKCSRDELEEGSRRFAIYADANAFSKIKQRTRERWRKRVREAEARWGASYGWVGLIPTYHNGGRRPVEFSPDVTKALERAFTHWENPAAIDFSAFWKLSVHYAYETKTVQMCCKKTAKRWLNERRSSKTTLVRDGSAVLNSNRPPLPINLQIPPYATRPWERVFIDHTMADIRLRLDTDTLDGKSIRPYFSVMIDDYSRKVLAYVIDFDPPCRDTCMHLIRECVRMHRCLPAKIAMDNGKEFKSIYFQTEE